MQWEVEALNPIALQHLVLTAVAPYVDTRVLAERIAKEAQQRRRLRDFVQGWS
ncbi:hypothetical protein [Streptomyces sp. NPDC055105]|uniref:hypothetical protein n=1 Tax=Streptomyces sp. NPDC055105 TaxID=3365719 RepID=UPI0037D19BF6